MPLISVVVPVFNTEKYLEKCLGSLAKQSFTDYEVILVDDGSTDKSGKMCSDFAALHTNFSCYHKENGGVSSARNLGMQKAQGKYIAFVDSDDYVNEDYLEKIAAPLRGKDFTLVQGGVNVLKKDSTARLIPEVTGSFDGKEYAEIILKRKLQIFLFQTLSTKLYNMDFVRGNHLSFSDDITISEDCLFNTEFLSKNPNSVCILDYAGYNYIWYPFSLTKTVVSLKRVQQSIKVGNLTLAMRHGLISRLSLEDNKEVTKGFQTAICIICISNARNIETNGFSADEKAKLYESYLPAMNYPVDLAIGSFEGTDRIIIKASLAGDYKKIGKIYNLRRMKTMFKKLIHLK